jgi:hypothetical protein
MIDSALLKTDQKIYRPRLTERDYLILKFIGEVDQVNGSVLHSKFFFEFARCTVRKFVSRMLRGGFLKKIVTFENQGVYTLSYSGVQAIRSFFNEQFFSDEIKFIRIDQTKHALDIAEIRSVLEKDNSIVSWESDRLIRRHKLKNFKRKYYPDAVFKSGEKTYLFEYERTLKSKLRIKKKIDSIEYAISDLWKNNIDALALVVTATAGIKRSYLESNNNSRIKVYSFDEIDSIEVEGEL